MKEWLKVATAAGLLMDLTGITWAHMGDKVFSIVELTDADLARIDIADGSVEDWLEVVGEPTLTALDFGADPTRAPYDPADMDFCIWLAWHRGTNHIYVAMERVDDTYLNNLDRSSKGCPNQECYTLFQDSFMAFYVDGDHSGGKFLFSTEVETREERLLLNHQQVQQYGALAEVHDTGPYVDMGSASFYADWFVKPPYAEGGGGIVGGNPAVSVTEFYVTPFDRFIWNSPETSVVSELFPGKTIGFSIRVIDTDTEDLKYKTILHMPLDALDAFPGNAEQFADGILVGPGGTPPAVSAVESDTWARIKASFGK